MNKQRGPRHTDELLRIPERTEHEFLGDSRPRLDPSGLQSNAGALALHSSELFVVAGGNNLWLESGREHSS